MIKIEDVLHSDVLSFIKELLENNHSLTNKIKLLEDELKITENKLRGLLDNNVKNDVSSNIMIIDIYNNYISVVTSLFLRISTNVIDMLDKNKELTDDEYYKKEREITNFLIDCFILNSDKNFKVDKDIDIKMESDKKSLLLVKLKEKIIDLIKSEYNVDILIKHNPDELFYIIYQLQHFEPKIEFINPTEKSEYDIKEHESKSKEILTVTNVIYPGLKSNKVVICKASVQTEQSDKKMIPK